MQALILALVILSLFTTSDAHAVCGDNMIDAGETCDDGNVAPGDGCSQNCITECPLLTGTWEWQQFGTPLIEMAVLESPAGTLSGALATVSTSGTRSSAEQFATITLTLDGVSPFPAGTLDTCDRMTFGSEALVFIRIRDTYCGDGSVEAGEQCDDGNFLSGDACTGFCTPADCGNGITELAEECDDGNDRNGDGCSTTCEANVCGNTIIEPGEECDDGNTANLDGCSEFCEVTACGNGALETGELCDDGNTDDLDGCSAACIAECLDMSGTWDFNNTGLVARIIEGPAGTLAGTWAAGGPGPLLTGTRSGLLTIDPVEVELQLQGQSLGPFYANSNCTLLLGAPAGNEVFRLLSTDVCGNGVLEGGEACDDGNFLNGDSCTFTCELEVCGNSILGPGEECDDGNLADEDGCSSACVTETCGDGTLQAGLGEECDDGGVTAEDGCSDQCIVEFCGDGIVQPGLGETCDDQNTDELDGCLSTCTTFGGTPGIDAIGGRGAFVLLTLLLFVGIGRIVARED